MLKQALEWRIFGASVRGSSHLRLGLPNQDAFEWLPKSEVGSPFLASGPTDQETLEWFKSEKGVPLLLAVSDGHGSAKSFRSHIGANLAIRAARLELKSFLKGQPDLVNLSAVKHMAEERLPQAIVREWKNQVGSHLNKNPITNEELAKFSEKEKVSLVQKEIEGNPHLAYGATLLAVLITDIFILALQLGDGDILSVDALGETTRLIPKDQKLMANETTSLCTQDAWKEVRVRVMPLLEEPPAMILVSTDGYSNSFKEDKDFLKIGRDYLLMTREGIDVLANSLEGILQESSERGSGDDITLGIIRRNLPTDLDSLVKEVANLQSRMIEWESLIERLKADLEKKIEGEKFEKAVGVEADARDQLRNDLKAAIEQSSSAMTNFMGEQRQLNASVERTLQELLSAMSVYKRIMGRLKFFQWLVIGLVGLAVVAFAIVLFALFQLGILVSPFGASPITPPTLNPVSIPPISPTAAK